MLILAAWLRGAEYDEQYTLFLTSGVPRPDWPVTVFPAGLARDIQAGHAGLLSIARDLRTNDVHPPLYFWLVALWRDAFGPGLFVARLLSVTLGLGALALTGVVARLSRVPPVWAILMTLGCYGFTYTSVIARGFALAQLLLLGGAAGLLLGRRFWHFALAGALLGAATMSNYLSVFPAGAFLLAVGVASQHRHPPPSPATRWGDLSRHGPDGTSGVIRRGIRMVRIGLTTAKLSPGEPRRHTEKARRSGPCVRYRFRANLAALARCIVAMNLRAFSVVLRVLRVRALRWLARTWLVALIPGITRFRVRESCEDGPDDGAPRPSRQTLAALLGLLVFIPGDLWWFLAQRGTRPGQFPPFSLGQSLGRLAVRFSGDLLGGLPLYVGGAASTAVTVALGLLMVWLVARIVWRWRRIGTPRARIMFALGALAPAFGLLALGAIFNNTPIEVRYLTFASPFVALLLAGALRARGIAVVLAVQAASIVGLLLAPPTMQPAHAAARLAAAWVEDGVVLLPIGNDGVGVVGAFAIEAPPALPLLLIPASDMPEQIRVRIGAWHRVVLALLEQDAASRSSSEAMRRALTSPLWREVAHGPNVAVYERIE